MAGEWIKFEANTPEKQEVFSITVAMGWDDPDLTVGKLLKVWRWFDQQTVDGNAPRVTSSLLDRILGVSGFAQAMCDVGWLVIDAAGLSLPNFDRHNGQTAKNRALTAKRVAKHKGNAEGNAKTNAPSVSAALPKEEKRREDSTESAQQKKTDAAGSRLPTDWKPSPEDIAYCKAERPDLLPSRVATNFYDYWIAKPGKDGRKADWSATWRSWVRKEDARSAGKDAAAKPPVKDWE